MPKRKEPKLPPAEQFKIFRETAKRHGLDESGKELEEAFKKVTPRARAARKASDPRGTDE